ncbi:conserved hypothetical protein [Streptomyces viridochromogenes DSM 40736]|uniref:DUF6777 domain-containing protein n=1 Tax=Streptomyces viridochromogenes (strain DSM 40736 / JCM 4977 / BCRC 1201 / Tue 494) TaxID=591159 RepID=D9X691_STRVT|nr:conserved hypothetical protein [Streptomyces viridochromogenes DSM 40736]
MCEGRRELAWEEELVSVEPPSSGRPTGPPSGPLSGPSQPPSGGGPPSEPPTGGGESPEPRRPWWGSAPRVALIAGAVVAAVILAVVLTRPDGGTGASDGGTSTSDGEIFLQPAADTGPDPFTDSTAEESSAPPTTPTPAGTTSQNAVQGVDGGSPGLYGGTRNVSSCDVEKQITYLKGAPDKQRAFASVLRIDPSDVPSYLRSLTPVQLRMDTRVTNHGFRDGRATAYQAILQAGTAVLVDDRGVPRVRCACGNPLTPPVAQQTAPKTTGSKWPGYKSSGVVVVTPAPDPIDVFVMCEPDGDWFKRDTGDTGKKDRKTRPPHQPTPSVTGTTPTSTGSASPKPPPTSEQPTSGRETTSEPPTSETVQSPPGNDTGSGTGGGTTEQAPSS